MAKEKAKKTKKQSFTYEYIGDYEVALPEFNLIVKPGDTVKVSKKIDNPLFKLVK